MKKVVLLGDSIRLIGYGKRVEELLGEQCSVWQPEDNCRFSKYTLRMLFDEQQNIKDADVIPGERGQEVWNRKRIGLAVADSIEGPFIRQDQPLLEPRDCSHWDCTITTNPSVVILPDGKADYESKFRLPEKIRTVCWLDNGANVAFCQDGQDVVVQTEPYRYGRSLVVRVAKITVEE